MLSIIGTPIGNLEDLSRRAARMLLEADVILAEDTRSVQTLLQRAKAIMTNNLNTRSNAHDDIGEGSFDNLKMKRQDSGQSQNDHSQKIVSYYKEVEFEKLPDIIGWLEAGLNVALVSEAGMPVISDPGHLLAQTAQKYRIPLTVIPGPSSVHTALVASGVKFDHYQFVGFLPKKDKERLKLFARFQTMQENLGKTILVFVAFESPERIQDTLTLLYETYPTMKIVLCRELTKKFEDVVFQPSASDVYRGEIVLIIDFGKQIKS